MPHVLPAVASSPADAAPPAGDAAADEACARVAAFAADADATALSLAGLGLRALPGALCALPPAAAARLARLDLARNALAALPDALAAALPSLRVLFLLSNRFEAVPSCLRGCAAMRMLSFKGNLLAEVEAGNLPPNLTWLILTSNRLERLPADFGVRTAAVVKLMLSNNALTEEGLPADFISPACELLRLNNNKLTGVPHAVFDAPVLAWLGLGGNPCTSKSRSIASLDPAARVSLGDYDLEARPTLGCGASGDVWRATEKASGDRVAVKVYRAMETSDGSVVDEMRSALALRGIGLIPVRAFFASDDGAFGLVMDLVSGMREVGGPPSFDSITRDVYPPVRFEALRDVEVVACEVAKVAAEMHRRRYAHGDLYGHNVLENAAESRCFLTDLGASYPYQDARIEKIEVRAYGLLVEELIGATPAEAGEAEKRKVKLLRLAEMCAGPALKERPTFAEVLTRLEGILE